MGGAWRSTCSSLVFSAASGSRQGPQGTYFSWRTEPTWRSRRSALSKYSLESLSWRRCQSRSLGSRQRVIVSSWCRWAAVMTVVRSSVDTPGSHGPAWKLPLMETDDEEDDDDSQWGRRRSVAARVRSTGGRATSSWLADGTEGGRRRETARPGVDGFIRLREWW